MVVLLSLVFMGISFLFTAGLVWLLPAIGVATIGSFVIVFSWKLALAVWLILAILRSVFNVVVKS